MKKTLVGMALLAATGCATQPPGPPPHGIFVGESVAEVQGKLVALCMDRGYHVAESTTAYVLCEKDATAQEDFAFRAVWVGAEGTETVKRARFSMASVTEGVRVMGTMTMESQGYGGQVIRKTVSDAKTSSQIREALVSAGAL